MTLANISLYCVLQAIKAAQRGITCEKWKEQHRREKWLEHTPEAAKKMNEYSVTWIHSVILFNIMCVLPCSWVG